MDVELAVAVAALRDELLDAATKATTAEMEFAVGPIELEFTVELRKDAKTKTGFKAWVVSGDVEAGVARSCVQRIKVVLTPRTADGGEFLVHSMSGLSENSSHDLNGHIGR